MKAIITGASSGIGLAISKSLSASGWEIASATRSELKATELISNLKSLHPKGVEPIIKVADLTIQAELESFIENVKSKWGCPDLIICNAGIYTTDNPSEITREKLLSQLEINAFQAIRLCNEWVSNMKSRNRGSIIFIGSIINIYPRTSAATYTLSKNLLNGYSKMLFDELRDTDIKITRIQPGSVATPSFDSEVAPLENFVKPEDIASAVSWILNLPATTQIEELIIRPNDKNW
ncbi:MAG: SDR family NAD(P)-dependent oxidoreductase [Bacteroidia bacterium]